MAGRNKKTSLLDKSIGSSSGSSSHVIITSGSSHMVRPSSPTLISRVEEKNQLASLNDRLAAYIERVRHLELENNRLMKIVSVSEESVSGESAKIKALFEQELADARRLLDQMAKEKAALQLELGKVRAELDELKAKIAGKDRALGDSEKRLMVAESQVHDLQSRMADFGGQKRRLEDEILSLRKELDLSHKQLDATKKQLEDETIRRVDLENRIQSYQEQLEFQKELHAREMSAAMERRRIDVTALEYDQSDLENQFGEALKQMRRENEEQIKANRDEVEFVFQKKFGELQNSTAMWQDQASRSQAELRTMRSRLDEVTKDLEKMTNKADGNIARIEYLERMLQQEKDDHHATLASKDAEIRKLRQELQEQLQEYRDLFDMKVQLDLEIAAYRKMLELEETRMSSMEAGGSSGGKRRIVSMTTRTATSPDSGSGSASKRSYIESHMYSSPDHGQGGVELDDIDVNGKYVRLYNDSDKDVNLSGWVLKQVDGSQQIVFKFQRNVIIKAHQTINIWSQDKSGVSHASPDIVMKNQSWLHGESKKTSLTDSTGEEIAYKEIKKNLFSSNDNSHNESSERSSSTVTRRGALSFFTGILF